MPTLRTVIESLGLAGQTSQQIATALAADVVTSSNSTPQNYAAMVRTFGLPAAEGILQALKSAGLEGAAGLYVGAGIDLSLDVSQQQLAALGAAVPELSGVCAQLKAIGKTIAPQWQASGLEALPSEEEVKTALSEIASQPQTEWTERNVLLSVNIGSKTIVALRVQAAAIVDGQRVAGDDVAKFTFTGSQSLSADQQGLVNAVKLAITKYTETL